MTTTYDPKHANYLHEADVRAELTRVYDVCQSCRLCTKFCASFPTLFEMLDRVDDRDAGRLTPAEQDRVVEECFQCKLCALNCPYAPGLHEWAVDFPRLMLRAAAMRRDAGHVPVRDRVTSEVMGRTDLLGTLGTRMPSVANRVVGAEPGSATRKLVAAATGVSAVRLLPPYAKQRFSTWFKRRPKVRIGRKQGAVTVLPTCVVEYQQPRIGHDLVKVYERNGIECAVSAAGCCGAPFLHDGDVERFTKVATKNVTALAAEVRKGTDIVVPQPTCSYVLKHDYLDHVGGPDAELVAAHTYDAVEYLMRVHTAEDTSLDTDFRGTVPATVTYHAPCHLRAQNIGLRSRDLLRLTGTTVKLVQQCSGVDGTWGLRVRNESIAVPMAHRLGEEIERAGGETIAGDCHLANTAILEQTGHAPVHPIQLVARAYGISEEP